MNNKTKQASEQPAQQEPVANIRTWRKNGELHAELWNWDRGIESLPDGEHDLYTSPPQRKPLTDEEIEEICWTEVDQRLRSFARAIEAKLKEKNT